MRETKGDLLETSHTRCTSTRIKDKVLALSKAFSLTRRGQRKSRALPVPSRVGHGSLVTKGLKGREPCDRHAVRASIVKKHFAIAEFGVHTRHRAVKHSRSTVVLEDAADSLPALKADCGRRLQSTLAP